MSSQSRAGDTIVGRYRLEETVGRGGFATVWRARDLDERRDVAVKIAREDSHDMDQIRTHFERAFDALRAIRDAGGHPNVVTALDGRISDRSAFIVTDLIEGPMLDDAVESGRVRPGLDTVHAIGEQVCDALAFLHRNEVLYLDLKPGNVMLDGGGSPVLIDFNTAVTGRGRDDTLFYEDAYKPTEQLPGDGSEITSETATDVYACGHLLAYLLTGERQGSRNRTSDTVDLDPEAVGCTHLLANVLRRASARYPGSRFRTCEDLCRALRAAQSDDVPTAVLVHPGSGESFTIRSGMTLGRDESLADLVVADPQEYVSPRHARIASHGTGWTVRDHSTNGTYVEKRRGWELALSDEGVEKVTAAGRNVGQGNRRPPRRLDLEDGDLISLVDPEYDAKLRFRTS